MRIERKYTGWSAPVIGTMETELNARETLIQKPTSLRADYYEPSGKWVVAFLSVTELSAEDKNDLDTYMATKGYQ